MPKWLHWAISLKVSTKSNFQTACGLLSVLTGSVCTIEKHLLKIGYGKTSPSSITKSGRRVSTTHDVYTLRHRKERITRPTEEMQTEKIYQALFYCIQSLKSERLFGVPNSGNCWIKRTKPKRITHQCENKRSWLIGWIVFRRTMGYLRLRRDRHCLMQLFHLMISIWSFYIQVNTMNALKRRTYCQTRFAVIICDYYQIVF